MTHCEIGFIALMTLIALCGIGVVMLSMAYNPKNKK